MNMPALIREDHKSRARVAATRNTPDVGRTMKGAAAAIAPGHDAKLFDLIRVWDETAARTAEASRLYEEIDERKFSPPKPAALAATDEDVKLGLCTIAKTKQSRLSRNQGQRCPQFRGRAKRIGGATDEHASRSNFREVRGPKLPGLVGRMQGIGKQKERGRYFRLTAADFSTRRARPGIKGVGSDARLA
jgi:hypothetical protein